MGIYGIDMGHPKNAGAVKILNETTENRKIGNRLIEMLKEKGHTAINCTNENHTNQLTGITNKANAQRLDLFVSIHLNAGGGHGTETYVYNGNYSGKADLKAKAKVLNDAVVASCGFRNRGVKEANFHVLRETIAPAMLVEVCFVDSQEDANKINTEAIARAMFKAITGVEYVAPAPPSNSQDWDNTEIKRYPEKGKCTVNTTLNFRNAPSTKTGVVQGQYYNGESVYYDWVVLTNRHVWISWIGAGGNRRYMAIKDKKTNERWGTCI